MKYLKQFMVILVFSFLGEALHFFLPLPVPASIYGLITFFICLCAKLITPSEVKETSSFLIEIMPFLFIPSAVGLMKMASFCGDYGYCNFCGYYCFRKVCPVC